jgi:hypothetical protein
MKKKCECCNSKFDALGGARYCCDKCRIKMRRIKDSKNHKKHYHMNDERKETRIKYATEWKKNNSEKARSIYSARNRRRRRENIKWTLRYRISASINKSLKRNKHGYYWEKLVGYTLKQLIERLQDTMPVGASWQDLFNGRLHIDHIKPIASFNFNSYKSKQFKECWALDNLQLLWARDNLIKGSKYNIDKSSKMVA